MPQLVLFINRRWWRFGCPVLLKLWEVLAPTKGRKAPVDAVALIGKWKGKRPFGLFSKARPAQALAMFVIDDIVAADISRMTVVIPRKSSAILKCCTSLRAVASRRKETI